MLDIILVGGGIGGLALAGALHRQGMRVQVLEAAAELKPIGAGILLAHNAQAALEHLGHLSTLVPLGHPLHQGIGYDHRGKVLSSYRAVEGAKPWLGIHRGRLHQGLLAQTDGEQITLNAVVKEVRQSEDKVWLRTQQGEEFVAKRVIAFDGIHSAIRQAAVPEVAVRYAGYTCWRGVVQGVALENVHQFSETMGRGTRFGIVPISPTETYWFACANAPRNSAALGELSATDLRDRYFSRYHAPVQELLMQTDSLYWNDIEDIAPLRTFRYGNVLLAGDAGHATTPNLGQGAGMALEDAATLYTLLQSDQSWEALCLRFQQMRQARTRWVTQTSRQFGAMGQWQHPLAVAVRNAVLRSTPKKVMQKQLQKLAKVDFGA